MELGKLHPRRIIERYLPAAPSVSLVQQKGAIAGKLVQLQRIRRGFAGEQPFLTSMAKKNEMRASLETANPTRQERRRFHGAQKRTATSKGFQG
jgi:hypothetical protein